MAIRVIGNKASSGEWILKPKIRIRESTGNAQERLAVAGESVTGVEHKPNIDDNDNQPNIDGEADFIDIESIASDNSGGGTDTRTYSGKRRGRKPGSGNKRGTSGNSTSKTTDAIASMLFVVHQVAGGMLKIPSVQISKDGAQQIADALLQVTQEYEAELLTAKQMAWLNLAGVMGKVYFFDEKHKPIVTVNGAAHSTREDKPVEIPDWMRPN